MEEKLAEYRARKAKEKASDESLVNRLRKSFSYNEKKSNSKDQNSLKKDDSELNNAVDYSQEQNDDLTDESPPQSSSMYWTLTFLKFLLWLCIWGLFIELQFGAVYFTLSLLLFIYFNTGSGRKNNNLSAYSVFNKDCERIQGTVTAEQMQRDMFRVPGLPS